MSVPKNSNDRMVDILASVQKEYEAREETRLASIQYAKSVGMTNQNIADHLGMTEGAIRAIIKRGNK